MEKHGYFLEIWGSSATMNKSISLKPQSGKTTRRDHTESERCPWSPSCLQSCLSECFSLSTRHESEEDFKITPA